MPRRKLHDEIKDLTSGIATTGLEYVKHRKKKKELRGGIVPLVVMGLQTAVMELANWALNEDARREQAEAERIERHNQQVYDRMAREEQARANNDYLREQAQESANIQRGWGEEYKQQLRRQLEDQKREEQQYYEQQDLRRRAMDSQEAEYEKRLFEGDAQRQNLSASQRRLAIQQEDAMRLREANMNRLNQGQEQLDAMTRASNQRFNLELQQRLRSAQAQQQAQAVQQQRTARRIAPRSTAQKMGRRR